MDIEEIGKEIVDSAIKVHRTMARAYWNLPTNFA